MFYNNCKWSTVIKHRESLGGPPETQIMCIKCTSVEERSSQVRRPHVNDETGFKGRRPAEPTGIEVGLCFCWRSRRMWSLSAGYILAPRNVGASAFSGGHPCSPFGRSSWPPAFRECPSRGLTKARAVEFQEGRQGWPGRRQDAAAVPAGCRAFHFYFNRTGWTPGAPEPVGSLIPLFHFLPQEWSSRLRKGISCLT